MIGVAFEVVQRTQQGAENDRDDQQVEVYREGIDLDGAVERVKGSRFDVAELNDAGIACGERGEDRQPAQKFTRAARLQAGLRDHDEHAANGKDDLGQQRQKIWGHYFTP